MKSAFHKALDFEVLKSMATEDLIARRVDLNRKQNVARTQSRFLREEEEAITGILRRRGKPLFEVSDHAIVRWLERVEGLDIAALRTKIARMLEDAPSNANVCRRSSDAVAHTIDGVVLIVARDNMIVTLYPETDGGDESLGEAG